MITPVDDITFSFRRTDAGAYLHHEAQLRLRAFLMTSEVEAYAVPDGVLMERLRRMIWRDIIPTDILRDYHEVRRAACFADPTLVNPTDLYARLGRLDAFFHPKFS
jgi:hypothetical protein